MLLVEPSLLKESFGLVVGIYLSDVNGKTLTEWLKQDWSMFSHQKMDLAHSKELLAEILDDGEIIRKTFVPSALCDTNSLDQWKLARKELMHKNRFFPETKLNFERIAELLPYLLVDPTEIQEIWFRARIQDSDRPFEIHEMGAPPKQKVTHGRANPAGIPYLYLASNAVTAIAELRPHTGELATVAEFILPKELKLVDLRNPRLTVSPFWLPSESEVALLRGDLEFLEHLGNELTRPVLPQAAAIDYIPSQFLCEFIKNRRFDGVMYSSSIGNGVNIALFDPSIVEVGTVSMHRVKRVSVEIHIAE